jgi:hypothetical protein
MEQIMMVELAKEFLDDNHIKDQKQKDRLLRLLCDVRDAGYQEGINESKILDEDGCVVR